MQTGTTDGTGNISMSGNYFSTTASDYTVFLNGSTSAVTITGNPGITGGNVTLAVGANNTPYTLIGPEKIDTCLLYTSDAADD
mgnify:CR=1 FL=1